MADQILIGRFACKHLDQALFKVSKDHNWRYIGVNSTHTITTIRHNLKYDIYDALGLCDDCESEDYSHQIDVTEFTPYKDGSVRIVFEILNLDNEVIQQEVFHSTLPSLTLNDVTL